MRRFTSTVSCLRSNDASFALRLVSSKGLSSILPSPIAPDQVCESPPTSPGRLLISTRKMLYWNDQQINFV